MPSSQTSSASETASSAPSLQNPGPDGLPHDAPPAWFHWAVSQPRQSHFAPRDEGRVHYVSWNAEDRDKPGLLFLHGFLGHAHWWDFIAPFFTATHRVFAMDFGGMGDSDHRPHYDRPSFVDDIAAVIGHAGIAPATVVAHSFGGSTMMYHGCTRLAEQLRHVVVVDSFVGFADDAPREPRPMGGSIKLYPSPQAAAARFKLRPEQPCAPWLMDYLATHSMRAEGDRWRWKFDAKVLEIPPPGPQTDLGSITLPFDYVYGQDSSIVNSARAERIVAAIPGARRGAIGIPSGLHHLMLDQPLALIGTLRALLG